MASADAWALAEWQHQQWQHWEWAIAAWNREARLEAAPWMMGHSEQPVNSGDYESEASGDNESDVEDMDIAAELQRIAAEALALIGDIIELAAVLQATLEPMTQTLMKLIMMPADVLGRCLNDDFEKRLAQALIQVDRLLPTPAAMVPQGPSPAAMVIHILPRDVVQKLKALQQAAQDLAILACSRLIDQKILRHKAIEKTLRRRMEAAFPELSWDDYLWSRLGNAKYNVWTHGVRFGERKHRHGRGGRGGRAQRTAAASSAAAASSPADVQPTASSSAAAASSAAASSSPASSIPNNRRERRWLRGKKNVGFGPFDDCGFGTTEPVDDGTMPLLSTAPTTELQADIIAIEARLTGAANDNEARTTLEEVLVQHNVNTPELQADIMRWRQLQISSYSMSFRF